MVLGARPGLFTEAFFRGSQIAQGRQRQKMEQERIKFQQQQLKQQTAAAQQTAQAKAQRQQQQDDLASQDRRSKMTALFGSQLQAAQNDPQRTQVLIEQGRRLSQQGLIDDIGLPEQPSALPSAERIQQVVQGAGEPGFDAAPQQAPQIDQAAVQDAATRAQATTQAPQPKGLQGKILEFATLNPEMRPGSPAFRNAFNTWDTKQRKSGAPSIFTGDLGKSVINKQQEKVLAAKESTVLLGQIKGQIEALPGGYEEFADGWKWAQSGTEAFLTKWAPGYTTPQARQESLGRYEIAQASVGIYRDAKIKAITGAQMSEPEAKRIMQSVPKPGDAPWVLKAKIAQWIEYDALVAKGGMDALRDGIRSGDISPESWKVAKPGGGSAPKSPGEMTDEELEAHIGQKVVP